MFGRLHPHRRRRPRGRRAARRRDWYPVNDHPLDKAAYTFQITVPAGLEAVANGELVDCRTGTVDDLDLGRRSRWPRTSPRLDRRVRLNAYKRRHQLLGRDRPGPLDASDAAHRDAVRHLAGRPAVVQAADADDRRPRPAARTCPSGSPATPNRTGTSCSSRRTRSAHDDWTTLRTSTATRPGHRVRLPVLARPASIPRRTTRPTTATAPARRPARPASWWAASGASDGYEQWMVDLGVRGQEVEVSISLRQRRLRPDHGRVRRRRRRLDRRRARPRSRTTATRSTGGRSPAPPPAASRTRTTGSPARRRTRRHRSGDDRRGRSPASREIIEFVSGIFGRIRSRRPAGSSTTWRASDSRSRTRPG